MFRGNFSLFKGQRNHGKEFTIIYFFITIRKTVEMFWTNHPKKSLKIFTVIVGIFEKNFAYSESKKKEFLSESKKLWTIFVFGTLKKNKIFFFSNFHILPAISTRFCGSGCSRIFCTPGCKMVYVRSSHKKVGRPAVF